MGRFIECYGTKSPEVGEILRWGWDQMVSFFEFQNGHSKHLKTSDPVEWHSAGQRQLLVCTALPRLRCYPAESVASRKLLPPRMTARSVP